MNWTEFKPSSRNATWLHQGLSSFDLICSLPLKFRLQKEKDDACSDIDRSRDKYDKLQVSSKLFSNILPHRRQFHDKNNYKICHEIHLVQNVQQSDQNIINIEMAYLSS